MEEKVTLNIERKIIKLNREVGRLNELLEEGNFESRYVLKKVEAA